jgi:hypothetical protein
MSLVQLFQPALGESSVDRGFLARPKYGDWQFVELERRISNSRHISRVSGELWKVLKRLPLNF